jgi:capsular exopolysaccharide synthesis family protein
VNDVKPKESISLDLSSLSAAPVNLNPPDFKKYLNVLWSRKYWILVVAMLVTLIWGFMYSNYKQKFTNYTTFAIIRFDDPRYSRDISPVMDYGNMAVEGKVAILQVNTFLGRVVDSLNLTIRLESPIIKRSIFLDKIYIDQRAAYGRYKIIFRTGNPVCSYETTDSEMENILEIQHWQIQDSYIFMQMPGFELKIDTVLFRLQKEITLSHIPRRYAIEMLKSNIKVNLNRSQTILNIGYSDKDPEFSALVTNTLANLFIQQLLDYKRLQTGSMISSLEEKLRVAQRDLEISEAALRDFNEANPYISLGNEGQRSISEMSRYEADLLDLNQRLEIINTLLAKLDKSSDKETRNYSFQEILSLLVNENIPGASILMDRFNQLLLSQQNLITANYSPEHPQLLRLDSQINDVHQQIKNSAYEYSIQRKNKISSAENSINQNKNNLMTLPRNQIRLAELERNRQIKERIVSNIMVRYNEAKVSDAAIIPDAYIIDLAEPPLIDQSFLNTIKTMAIGMFIGLFLGAGLFVVAELFNKTPKTPKDLELKLKFPVLGVIPKIKMLKSLNFMSTGKNKFDPALVTSDYAPTYESEAFRSIRAKLVLKKDVWEKAFLVTSMNPNEGKSLVASNLAITFAQQHLRTLLVDSDLRRGVLHNSFAYNKIPGLTDIILSDHPDHTTFENSNRFIQQTHIPNLFLISCGSPVPNPSETLGSQKMADLYKHLSEHFEVLIFDTPPFHFIPDAMVLSTLVKNILLVVKYGETNLNKLNEVLSEYPESRHEFLGAVLNSSKENIRVKNNYQYTYYKY